MIKDIWAVRDRFEASAFGRQAGLESQALALWKKGDSDGARALLTKYSDDNAAAVLTAWWQLAELLYSKYNDGYLNTRQGLAQAVFYPAWWLEKVGYPDGPVSYAKPDKAGRQ